MQVASSSPQVVSSVVGPLRSRLAYASDRGRTMRIEEERAGDGDAGAGVLEGGARRPAGAGAPDGIPASSRGRRERVGDCQRLSSRRSSPAIGACMRPQSRGQVRRLVETLIELTEDGANPAVRPLMGRRRNLRAAEQTFSFAQSPPSLRLRRATESVHQERVVSSSSSSSSESSPRPSAPPAMARGRRRAGRYNRRQGAKPNSNFLGHQEKLDLFWPDSGVWRPIGTPRK